MDVNIHEAKTHLSRLLRRVAAGEEITISRAGTPVAKLIGAATKAKSRPMGMDKGKIHMSDEFDGPDPELQTLFYSSITSEAPDPKRARKPKKP